jgi:hypothetical protein
MMSSSITSHFNDLIILHFGHHRRAMMITLRTRIQTSSSSSSSWTKKTTTTTNTVHHSFNNNTNNTNNNRKRRSVIFLTKTTANAPPPTTDNTNENNSNKKTNIGAFDALREAQNKNKNKNDPFSPPNTTTIKATTTSSNYSTNVHTYVNEKVDIFTLPTLRESDTVLKRFDDEQRSRMKLEVRAVNRRPSHDNDNNKKLGECVRALSYYAERIMFGICAESGAKGIEALKLWTEELNLPKGKLHGLDDNGHPKPIPTNSVFIKYNSLSGDAFCSEYLGEFRGVLFTPEINDGVFRQYGYLPIELFDK